MTAAKNGRPSATVAAKPVIVFVICRVRLYREMLIKLLNRQAGIRALGGAKTLDDLVVSLQVAAPDTVLLDLGSPDALTIAADLLHTRPGTRILGFGVDEASPQVIACAEAGLCGYVPGDASVAELARAARRVASGDTVCSGAVAAALFDYLRGASRRMPQLSAEAPLTDRQRQVLALIRKGLSNKEIAQHLVLSPSTIKNHVHELLNRLQVGRRSEAVARTRAETSLRR